MFFLTQPEIRDAEVYTALPDEFRRNDADNPWAAANRGGIPVHSFLEGPVFDSHGNLYVTDIPYGRIFKIAPDRQWSLIAE